MELASSFCIVNWEYEVFLNFRGADTCNNFVSLLYNQLKLKGIHTFKDDKELKSSESISLALLGTIERSRFAIVVLSKNYAFSEWCLDELVKIVECKEAKGQTILPIFYKVDPSDVEKQTGTFAKAFEEHKQNFDDDRVKRWRIALSTVATISNWDSQNNFEGNEAMLIDCVVEKIRNASDKLICIASSYNTNLVGMDNHVMKIEKLLDLECNDIQMVGIWGSGGIGKTTIAKFIYERYCSKFDACCYLEDVKEKYKNSGAIVVQKELLFQVLYDFDQNIWSSDMGCSLICIRLCGKRALIVLDNIDTLKQLKDLANETRWFGQGSRIIITTRDKRLLVLHGVKLIYEVPTMVNDHALQLFSLHAFKKNQPPNDFFKLSNKFITYAQGLPLALKVLGNSLYNREVGFWQGELEKLKKKFNVEIYHVLKISYDGLDELQQEVFLDIVFFFKRWGIVKIIEVLDKCGFHPRNVLPILEEKALITSFGNILNIHDMIQDMGLQIVRENSKEPGKRSRLCDAEDIRSVLEGDKGTSFIEGMCLEMTRNIKPINLRPYAFEKMDGLRILDFHFNSDYLVWESEGQFCLEDGLTFNYLPDKLSYLRWDANPAKSLPDNFTGKNLVELHLLNSKLEYFCTKKMELESLKIIDLSYSQHLKAANLSTATNIMSIALCSCKSFVEFSKDLKHLQKLHTLDMRCCKKLAKLPRLPSSLENLQLGETAIEELPPEFHLLKNLKDLRLFCCENLKALPKQLGDLESLKFLELSYAVFEELPESIGNLHELCELLISRCSKLMRLPSCMHNLIHLQVLNIRHCKNLCSLPVLPPSLEMLRADYCESLKTLPSNSCFNLKYIKNSSFTDCNKLDRKACDEILEHTKAMILQRQTINQEGNVDGNLQCIVPGDEIPKWFQYKSPKSSVTIQLPSNIHHVSGLAFCVVYASMESKAFVDNFHPFCVASCVLLNLESVITMHAENASVNHVAVWFKKADCLPNNLLSNYVGHDITFHFDIKVPKSKKEESDIEVRKCGVYLVSVEGAFAIIPNSLDKGTVDGNASEYNGISPSNLYDQSFTGNSDEIEMFDESYSNDEQCSKMRKISTKKVGALIKYPSSGFWRVMAQSNKRKRFRRRMATKKM